MTPRNTEYTKYDLPGVQVSDDALAQKYLLYTPPSRLKRKMKASKIGIYGHISSRGWQRHDDENDGYGDGKVDNDGYGDDDDGDCEVRLFWRSQFKCN